MDMILAIFLSIPDMRINCNGFFISEKVSINVSNIVYCKKKKKHLFTDIFNLFVIFIR